MKRITEPVTTAKATITAMGVISGIVGDVDGFREGDGAIVPSIGEVVGLTDGDGEGVGLIEGEGEREGLELNEGEGETLGRCW